MVRRAPVRAPLSLLATVAAVILGITATARAKGSLQAFGNVAVGWTDNVLNAPTQAVAPQSPPVSDFFLQIAPGVALTTAAPRLIQRLAYNFSADLFVSHSEGNSYSNTLDWAGFFATSRASDLLVVLQSQQGRLNTLNLNLPAAAGVANVVTSATSVNFFNQVASESFGWDLNAQWRASQLTYLQAFIPLDRTTTVADSFSALEELAADRRFRLDSLGAVLRCDLVDYEPVRDPTTNVASDRQAQVITSLAARWRRDWSPGWSTEAALGLVEASTVVGVGDAIWAPSALAAVRWFRNLSTAELRYAHDVLPNPLSSTTFIYDSVSLRGSVALPARSHLFLGATVDYEHAQQTAAANVVGTGSADVLLADASIDYRPIPELGLYVRYTLYDQLGSLPPSPMMQPTFPNILRDTVLIGINVIYPALPAARVPTRGGTRVDRTDQPGFPELHSQPQK